MKKKIINLFAVLALISTMLLPVNAETVNQQDFESLNLLEQLTEEANIGDEPMPTDFNRTSLFKWEVETKHILEEVYDQKVIDVRETDREIIFFFEELPVGEEYVVNVTYHKPESGISLLSYEGNTKVVKYARGYSPPALVRSTSNIIGNTVKNVLMTLAGIASSIFDIIGIFPFADFPSTSRVHTDIYRQGNRYHKVGSYYNRFGIWQPTTTIGMHNVYEYAQGRIWYPDKPAKPFHRPNVFWKSEYKPGYLQNDAWWKSRIIANYNSGITEYDVY